MSKTSNAAGRRGRPPTTPRTERGRQILAAISGQGLTLYAAARKAKIAFPTLHGAIHGDPSGLSVRTVHALCGRLGLPLSLVAPQLAGSAVA